MEGVNLNLDNVFKYTGFFFDVTPNQLLTLSPTEYFKPEEISQLARRKTLSNTRSRSTNSSCRYLSLTFLDYPDDFLDNSDDYPDNNETHLE